MGRLIDADKLLEETRKDRDYAEKNGFLDMYYERQALIDRIESQPTAYDIDKVITKLEELDVKSITRYKNGNFGDFDGIEYYIKKREAIEIVKQGIVSDDVCEWRLCDEEANVYDTSCRNPHILIEGTPKENNYEYCPYCGKKIKIVGD